MEVARKTVTIDSFGTEIEGLRDFTRALDAVAGQFPAQMKGANFRVANALVVKAKALAANEPGVASKAARSLRASRSASFASIRGGGARFPYFFGAEFGSKRYKQFQAFRGNQWGGWSGGPGYFLHPAIRKYAPEAVDLYMRQINALAATAFPD